LRFRGEKKTKRSAPSLSIERPRDSNTQEGEEKRRRGKDAFKCSKRNWRELFYFRVGKSTGGKACTDIRGKKEERSPIHQFCGKRGRDASLVASADFRMTTGSASRKEEKRGRKTAFRCRKKERGGRGSWPAHLGGKEKAGVRG